MIKSKCLKLIYLLFKCFNAKSALLYINFFKSYVIPIIDYLCIFYCTNNKSNIRYIESIQKRFTKCLYARMYGKAPLPHYEQRLTLFGLTSLNVRYDSIDLNTLFNITSNKLICDFSPKFSSRYHQRLVLTPINTSLYRYSFFHRSLTLWNKHSKALDMSSFTSFKRSALNCIAHSSTRA